MGLLLFPPCVADVSRPHHRARHDFFFEREVPVVDPRIGQIRIHEVGVEAARDQPRIVDVDDESGVFTPAK